MSATENYNGWSNRETWLVNLWLTNDERLYTIARGCDAETLETFVDDQFRESAAHGFALDMLLAATSRVDWTEIVASLAAD